METETLDHSYRLPFSFSPFLSPFTSSKSLTTTKTFCHLCNLSLGIVERCSHESSQLLTVFSSINQLQDSGLYYLIPDSGLYYLIGGVGLYHLIGDFISDQRLVPFCQRSVLSFLFALWSLWDL